MRLIKIICFKRY